MCMTVYLASSVPLPAVPWDEQRPSFHVVGLPPSQQAVRGHFRQPYAYYAGSHEGCGCGFQYGEYEAADPDAEELAELERHKQSRALLADYLKEALRGVPQIELYACWDGDEGLAAEHQGRVHP